MKFMQQHLWGRSWALVTDVDLLGAALGEFDVCSVGPGVDRIYISPHFLTDLVFTYLCQLTLRLIGIRSGRYVYLENLHHLSPPPSPSLFSPIPWLVSITNLPAITGQSYIDLHPFRRLAIGQLINYS